MPHFKSVQGSIILKSTAATFVLTSCYPPTVDPVVDSFQAAAADGLLFESFSKQLHSHERPTPEISILGPIVRFFG